MLRTNIYLEEHQTVALDAFARRAGVTRAEIVRRLIDRGLAAESRILADDLDAIEASFGALSKERVDVAQRSGSSREDHLDRLWEQ
jgi:hypothetical protein